MKILVIGYGNPSRGDDGLGISLIQEIERANIPDVATDSDYQLNIEHAVDVSGMDRVIFVDASLSGKEPYEFDRIEPSSQITFTTHSVNAESVLALCRDIYGTSPESWMLGIRGYTFELGERLSEKAEENLHEAVEFLVGYLRELNLIS
jgi:hydrogenase maturation protease